MLTSKYTHVWSFKAFTGAAPIAGSGFGDVDLCTAGQFNQGAIIDRIPRYPSMQYQVFMWDTAGSAAAATARIEALQPDGSWQIVTPALIASYPGIATATGVWTIPLSGAAPGAVSWVFFGPFLDLRVFLISQSTGGSINAVIYKFG